MNKTELIAQAAKEANVSGKDAGKVIAAAIGAIEQALEKGDKVQIAGFGTFEVRERGERTGKNLQTGETIRIAACKTPAFKAGKQLKDAVNKK